MRGGPPVAFLAVALILTGFEPPKNRLEIGIGEATRKLEARDFQGASATLKSLAAAYPREVRVCNLSGILEGELGHTAAARDAFERGLHAAPNDISLNENLGLLFYREERYVDAKRYLARALGLGGTNPGAAFSLAAAKIRTGEAESGLADLEKLETALPRYPEYWAERGWAELTLSPATAEISFSRALLLAPDDLRALNGAAAASEAQKLDEKALSFLLRAKQAHPENVGTLVHLGTVCLRRDLTLDAVAVLERAHNLAPSNNAALYTLARAQIGVQQWQKAHDLFREFAGRVPSFAPTYYALGWLDIKLGRRAQARVELKHSLQLAPALTDARYELAQLDVEDGNLEAAASLLKTVLEQDPRHVQANIAYGDVFAKKGDPASAQARYEAAIQMDPASGPAHYKLSTVLFRQNRSAEAEKERALGAGLNAEALRSSKVVMRLSSPDGSLLSAVQ